MGSEEHSLGGLEGERWPAVTGTAPPGSSVTQGRPASLAVGQGSKGGLLSFPQGIGGFCQGGRPWISDMKWPDLTPDSLTPPEEESYSEPCRFVTWGDSLEKQRSGGLLPLLSFPGPSLL